MFAFFYLVTITIFFGSVLADFSSGGHNKYPVSFKQLASCQEFDIASKACNHFIEIQNFQNFKSNEYKLYLKFHVLTTNDANIVLSNARYMKGSVQYTIVIGGRNDTYSRIRNTTGSTVGLDSHISDILSPLWATPIVVRQKHNGELEVAIPDLVDPLLKANASDLVVRSVCLYAWQTDSRWFYNCAEEDEVRLVKLENIVENFTRQS